MPQGNLDLFEGCAAFVGELGEAAPQVVGRDGGAELDPVAFDPS
jgi:hypothetical protein